MKSYYVLCSMEYDFNTKSLSNVIISSYYGTRSNAIRHFRYFINKLRNDDALPDDFDVCYLGIRCYATFADRLRDSRNYTYTPFPNF